MSAASIYRHIAISIIRAINEPEYSNGSCVDSDSFHGERRVSIFCSVELSEDTSENDEY
jgi:hypothetical protein